MYKTYIDMLRKERKEFNVDRFELIEINTSSYLLHPICLLEKAFHRNEVYNKRHQYLSTCIHRAQQSTVGIIHSHRLNKKKVQCKESSEKNSLVLWYILLENVRSCS